MLLIVKLLFFKKNGTTTLFTSAEKMGGKSMIEPSRKIESIKHLEPFIKENGSENLRALLNA